MIHPGTQAIMVYRLGHWLDKLRVPVLRQLLKVFFIILQYFVSWRVGIFIPVKARIGPGFVIHTWGGGCFLPNATIGRNFTIVGGGVLMDFETREIGDNVSIGAGTKVAGKVRIGHDVRTGPNSVVTTDVPDGCVVFGNPGRIIGPVPRLSQKEGGTRFVPAAAPRPSAPESK